MSNPKPAVLIDARESGTSTGRYVDKLVEYLHKTTPDYKFVILTRPERAEYFKRISPGFELVKTRYRKGTFGEQLGLVWQLYGINKKLVHFGMVQQPLLYFGKSVTTIHDLTTVRFRNPAGNRLIFWIKQMVYKRVVKRAARKSACVITLSEYVKRDVAQYCGINPAKIIVTYEAADRITDKAEPLKVLAGQKFIMYVGRAQPHKNLERLVQAFTAVRASHPDLKLVLAGRKDELYRRLERKVADQGFEGVIFTGFVSEGQLRWLYENCRAYVFASLSEGFGLPPLEAMVHGAPVISSNATCLPEINGTAALYFDPEDTADMAAKIDQLLADDKLRQKLIAAGRKQADKYSWQRMAEQTAAAYAKVIKNT